ncbi:MAG: 3-deoxy-manno-octulosonate cytidylyltransferase [Verrucomicrobia bacterium]|nr:3-deoxy-manno-octulosonate cytidylyltransferase [Verrucomicrobiota bacterium]
MQKPRIIAIIPARYASSRFPGKLLATILGKSVLQRTYESTSSCKMLDDVIIAADDERIMSHVNEFGGRACLTSTSCLNGTERLIEALERFPEITKADIIVNVQGDEPCIASSTIEAVLGLLRDDPSQVMATAAVRITNPDDILSPSVVKCVMNQQGEALYFSRSPIPAVRPGSPPASYFQHLGIYAFRREFLLKYGTLPTTPLQIAEDLEQLKVIEAGYKIKVAHVAGSSPHVDVPEDIQKVTNWIEVTT